MCSFPQSNLVSNSQQIFTGGMLQAITMLGVPLDLLPCLGAGASLSPWRPSEQPSSERWSTTALEQVLKLIQLPGELVKNPTPDFALDFLHQQHPSKGLEISHLKQCPSNSIHEGTFQLQSFGDSFNLLWVWARRQYI